MDPDLHPAFASSVSHPENLSHESLWMLLENAGVAVFSTMSKDDLVNLCRRYLTPRPQRFQRRRRRGAGAAARPESEDDDETSNSSSTGEGREGHDAAGRDREHSSSAMVIGPATGDREAECSSMVPGFSGMTKGPCGIDARRTLAGSASAVHAHASAASASPGTGPPVRRKRECSYDDEETSSDGSPSNSTHHSARSKLARLDESSAHDTPHSSGHFGTLLPSQLLGCRVGYRESLGGFGRGGGEDPSMSSTASRSDSLETTSAAVAQPRKRANECVDSYASEAAADGVDSAILQRLKATRIDSASEDGDASSVSSVAAANRAFVTAGNGSAPGDGGGTLSRFPSGAVLFGFAPDDSKDDHADDGFPLNPANCSSLEERPMRLFSLAASSTGGPRLGMSMSMMDVMDGMDDG